MSKLIAQGTLDGFCGVYAATHLMTELTGGQYNEGTEHFFFQILRGLADKKKLTPERIGSHDGDKFGFSCKHLSAAINAIPSRSSRGLAAISFTRTTFKNSVYCKNAQLAFKDGCGFVMQVDQGSHWVSTRHVSKQHGYKVFDPSHDRDHKHFSKIFWDEGLMIGPRAIIQDIS